MEKSFLVDGFDYVEQFPTQKSGIFLKSAIIPIPTLKDILDDLEHVLSRSEPVVVHIKKTLNFDEITYSRVLGNGHKEGRLNPYLHAIGEIKEIVLNDYWAQYLGTTVMLSLPIQTPVFSMGWISLREDFALFNLKEITAVLNDFALRFESADRKSQLFYLSQISEKYPARSSSSNTIEFKRKMA